MPIGSKPLSQTAARSSDVRSSDARCKCRGTRYHRDVAPQLRYRWQRMPEHAFPLARAASALSPSCSHPTCKPRSCHALTIVRIRQARLKHSKRSGQKGCSSIMWSVRKSTLWQTWLQAQEHVGVEPCHCCKEYSQAAGRYQRVSPTLHAQCVARRRLLGWECLSGHFRDVSASVAPPVSSPSTDDPDLAERVRNLRATMSRLTGQLDFASGPQRFDASCWRPPPAR